MFHLVDTQQPSSVDSLSISENPHAPHAPLQVPGVSARLIEAMSLSVERQSHGRTVGGFGAVHPWGAAALVWQFGGQEDEVIAALLYNVAIRQGDGLADASLEERFGLVVERILAGCAEEALGQREFLVNRKLRFLQAFVRAPHGVKLVSLAYKLQSVRAMIMGVRQEPVRARGVFNARQRVFLQYHREVIHVLRQCWSHPLIHELEAAIQEMERLK
jgi:hypothetical protein